MGQEIESTHFTEDNFKSFNQRLRTETEALTSLINHQQCSTLGPVAGFELEVWLLTPSMTPAPRNTEFLARLNNPLACPELAKFNIELNNQPQPLKGSIFSQMQRTLEQHWAQANTTAQAMRLKLAMIGILPTLQSSDLNLNTMSDQNRYRALNEQILAQRGKPIHLEIVGRQHLSLNHHDVMLESAATSFQLHLQVPLQQTVSTYNASIVTSAPLVALSANSPYLFATDLWDETRIPVFEQSIEVGGYNGARHGPLRRVSFGSDYARRSIAECFQENLQHFPVLLPMLFDSAINRFEHLRLHNGTIWRWNRPLVGFDEDGAPHIRIEQRVVPAGPSITDTVANAVFFYGLTTALSQAFKQALPPISFAQAKDNFYQAARHGLGTHIVWMDGKKYRMQTLILEQLIPQARQGLESLAISATDVDYYLSIIQARVSTGLNGAEWQRRYIAHHGNDFTSLMRAYLDQQKTGLPVHEWVID